MSLVISPVQKTLWEETWEPDYGNNANVILADEESSSENLNISLS